MHFGARILVRPQIVARHHGTIRHSRHPVVLTRRPERNRPLRIIQSPHAARRIRGLIVISLAVRILDIVVILNIIVLDIIVLRENCGGKL